MSEYTANIKWARSSDEAFLDNRYSRAHTWSFDGGLSVPASSSPDIVRAPYSVAENVDPEEAFVASISSCHMLFFLSIAAKQQWVVDSYTDNAIGIMQSNEYDKLAMAEVKLRPNVKFSKDQQPTEEQIKNMHHLAHEQCFIASSVISKITVKMVC